MERCLVVLQFKFHFNIDALSLLALPPPFFDPQSDVPIFSLAYSVQLFPTFILVDKWVPVSLLSYSSF